MSRNRKIDFSQGIRTVMKRRHSDRRLDKKSTDLLNTILNEVNDRLVEQFNDEFDITNKDQSGQLAAQKAVEKTFLGKLKKHAVYESSRQLALYDTGVMSYNTEEELEYQRALEREERSKKQVTKVAPPPESYLRSGVTKMCPDTHSLRRDAKDFLSDQLQQFVRLVTGEIDISDGQLQPKDIRDVLGKFLGPDVMRIAASEGNRALALHANGFLAFKPKAIVAKSREIVPTKESEMSATQGEGIFRLGLRRFLKEYDIHATIDKKTIQFIESILYNIAEYIAQYSSEVCQVGGKLEVSDADVMDCVKYEFPDMLKQHALIQGFQDVEAFHQGLLIYRMVDLAPRDSNKMKEPSKKRNKLMSSAKGKRFKASKKKLATKNKSSGSGKKADTNQSATKVKKKTLDFTTAILDCFPNLFPDIIVSADKKATTEIENILNDVCECLATAAAECCKGEELGIMEINNAVEKLFTGELQHHAVMSAANTVMAQRLGMEEHL